MSMATPFPNGQSLPRLAPAMSFGSDSETAGPVTESRHAGGDCVVRLRDLTGPIRRTRAVISDRFSQDRRSAPHIAAEISAGLTFTFEVDIAAKWHNLLVRVLAARL
jgi:hypothetical protein